MVYAATGSNKAAVVKLAVAEKHMLDVPKGVDLQQVLETRRQTMP